MSSRSAMVAGTIATGDTIAAGTGAAASSSVITSTASASASPCGDASAAERPMKARPTRRAFIARSYSDSSCDREKLEHPRIGHVSFRPATTQGEIDAENIDYRDDRAAHDGGICAEQHEVLGFLRVLPGTQDAEEQDYDRAGRVQIRAGTQDAEEQNVDRAGASEYAPGRQTTTGSATTTRTKKKY